MNKLVRIQNGESLPFKFDRDGAPIDGWVCTIFLKQFPSDTDLLTGVGRIIPPELDQRAWIGFLTNSETTTLVGGQEYFLIAALVNLSSNELEEVPVRVSVSESWVP